MGGERTQVPQDQQTDTPLGTPTYPSPSTSNTRSDGSKDVSPAKRQAKDSNDDDESRSVKRAKDERPLPETVAPSGNDQSLNPQASVQRPGPETVAPVPNNQSGVVNHQPPTQRRGPETVAPGPSDQSNVAPAQVSGNNGTTPAATPVLKLVCPFGDRDTAKPCQKLTHGKHMYRNMQEHIRRSHFPFEKGLWSASRQNYEAILNEARSQGFLAPAPPGANGAMIVSMNNGSGGTVQPPNTLAAAPRAANGAAMVTLNNGSGSAVQPAISAFTPAPENFLSRYANSMWPYMPADVTNAGNANVAMSTTTSMAPAQNQSATADAPNMGWSTWSVANAGNGHVAMPTTASSSVAPAQNPSAAADAPDMVWSALSFDNAALGADPVSNDVNWAAATVIGAVDAAPISNDVNGATAAVDEPTPTTQVSELNLRDFFNFDAYANAVPVSDDAVQDFEDFLRQN